VSEGTPSAAPSRSLQGVLTERGALPPRTALAVFRQLLTHVRALHAAGRTHRGIGPDAVYLDAAGRATLAAPEPSLPFGGSDADAESSPPELHGAPAVHLPAEIEAASQELNRVGVALDPRRIDVYQLGALLCRMITGEAVSAYLRSPKSKSKVPALVQPLIENALGYSTAARFIDCDQYAAALEPLFQKKPASASEMPPGGSAAATPLKTPPDETPLPTLSSPSQAAGAGDLPFSRLGHYRIVERIGRGGMGDVYLGYEESLQRRVAIKVLPAELARDEDFVCRFQAEATAAAKLTHPNIVPIYFIGQDASCHYFAMQYVEGESLERLLARRGCLEVEEAMGILEQCLAGLGAAHQAGLVHRDVKPGNILLDGKTGRALVADFGLVKTSGGGTGMTATGVILGTVDYIAPEQARGQAVDGRADLYALGVLAYRMLSGRLPFQAETPSVMIFQHAYEKPPPLRGVAPETPGTVADIVDRLMAKDPAARYQSGEEVLADLRRWRAGEPLAGRAQPTPEVRPSQIIRAPTFERPLDLPIPLEQTAAPAWWQRWRDRVMDWYQGHAPEALKGMQNTEQQVDGAVAEYQRRRDRLASLVGEATEAAEELAAQAESHRVAAAAAARRAESAPDDETARRAVREKEDCERIASDLASQAAEQQEQISQMGRNLHKVDATLKRLRSQRDLLRGRLRVANARLRMEGGSARPRLPRRLAVAAGLGLLLFLAAALFFALVPRGTTPAGPILPPGNDLTGTADEEITNSIGMKLKLIQAGTFLMGSPARGTGSSNDEHPQHEVAIQRPFYMGVHPVTRGQFAAFVAAKNYQTDAETDGKGATGYDAAAKKWEQAPQYNWKNPGFEQKDDHPVVNVTWFDAMQFCRWLGHEDGKTYDLPTEAEWEYACRAGTNKQYVDSDDMSSLRGNANIADASLKAKCPEIGVSVPWDDGFPFTSPVSYFPPNAWGLYDMHGNVRQWCADRYGPYPGAEKGPNVPDNLYSARGGSWYILGTGCRSNTRAPNFSVNRDASIGFRVVLRPAGGNTPAAAGTAGAGNPQQPLVVGDHPLQAGPLALSSGGNVTAAAFSPDGKRLVVADTKLRLWDLERNKEIHDFGGTVYSPPLRSAAGQLIVGSLRAVAWSADRRRVLLGGSDVREGRTGGVAILFEADTGKVVATCIGHPTAVCAVALSSDGAEILTAGDVPRTNVGFPVQPRIPSQVQEDSEVRRWDAATGKELKRYRGPTAPVHSLAFSADRKRVFASGSDQDPAVYSWNAETADGLRLTFPWGIRSYAVLLPDASKVAHVGTNWAVRIYDLKDGNQMKELCHSEPLAKVPDPAPECPAWSRDGRFVACSSQQYPNKPGKAPIYIVDAVSGKVVRTLEGHKLSTQALAISDDGRFVFSGSADGNRLWDVTPNP
jgi:formylglycine-generating enzyme required for sulfatase activity/serine/threonine protein kinase/WD40 repeat protein